MSKILYCNLCAKWNVEGHKYFDVKWANLLAQIADVDLLAPEEGWYKGQSNNINTIVYDSEIDTDKKPVVNWDIWAKEPFRHLALRSHTDSIQIMKYVLKQDKKNHYDYFLVSTFDIIVFPSFLKKFKNTDRIFLIQHQSISYQKRTWKYFFNKFKNRINHFVMEKDAIEYFQEQYSVERKRIHYIPHMLNPIEVIPSIDVIPYDVVGISNSNSEEEIAMLINEEKASGFFRKNNIRAIFRSKNLEYSNEWMTVIKGRLCLSFEEYYKYIVMAKIIILPFDINFGLRSSGTILDAFSNQIPIVGTNFLTMQQYQKRFPSICKIYESYEELCKLIIQAVDDSLDYTDEFIRFCEERSDEELKNKLKQLFV